MKLIIDTEENTLQIKENSEVKVMNLYSKEAFEIISHQWKRIGWNEKYIYTFSWLGRPIIQLPEDMIRIQEIIYDLKPDVIVETGIAHGGSLIYYASILNSIGKGRVIGVDIEIRDHNRKAIEEHELFYLIHLIEGNSTDYDTIEKIKSSLSEEEKVMVLLDSCHTQKHVYDELEMYSKIVSKGSYIVVEDGGMEDLWDLPRGDKNWKKDNPVTAIKKFLDENKNFILEAPKWRFNESKLDVNITHWNSAWLKRIF